VPRPKPLWGKAWSPICLFLFYCPSLLYRPAHMCQAVSRRGVQGLGAWAKHQSVPPVRVPLASRRSVRTGAANISPGLYGPSNPHHVEHCHQASWNDDDQDVAMHAPSVVLELLVLSSAGLLKPAMLPLHCAVACPRLAFFFLNTVLLRQAGVSPSRLQS
jgi:hypothetical protein